MGFHLCTMTLMKVGICESFEEEDRHCHHPHQENSCVFMGIGLLDLCNIDKHFGQSSMSLSKSKTCCHNSKVARNVE